MLLADLHDDGEPLSLLFSCVLHDRAAAAAAGSTTSRIASTAMVINIKVILLFILIFKRFLLFRT